VIVCKSPAEIEKMRAASALVAEVLGELATMVAPGVTSLDLDAAAERMVRDAGAEPAFKGYRGYPNTLCASVNEQVIHGIPSSRPLVEGDIISLDMGVKMDGFYGDSAITVPVGRVSEQARLLLRVTEESLWRGIAAALSGGKVGNVSHAIEAFVRSQGQYGITEGFTGHGIGREMHEPPTVPNAGRRGRGPKLVPGVVIAIEPMITLGTAATDLLEDDWTAVTTDGSWAAHFEHTVAITARGPWVLTARDGGAAKLAELGVPCGDPSLA